MEQRSANFSFQILDLLAKRRLPDPDTGRGAREILLLSDGKEVSNVTQFHELVPKAIENSRSIYWA
jgi:hypothetical protein